MARRTTVEIDEDLLARAKKVLGLSTTRATVEEALRRAAQSGEDDQAVRATGQRTYLERLDTRLDVDVLAAGEMWR